MSGQIEERAIKATLQTYDQIAEGYSVSVDATLANLVGAFEQWLLDMFAAMLPGNVALDLGCGNGHDTVILSSKIPKINVLSVDFSKGMLDVARSRFPDGAYLQMDMRCLGFRSGSVDGIWANGCVYHLPKEVFSEALLKIRELLKSNGIFSFNFKIGKGEGLEDHPRSYDGGQRYYAYYLFSEMTTLLEDSGFEILSNVTYPMDIFGEKIVHFWAIKKSKLNI